MVNGLIHASRGGDGSQPSVRLFGIEQWRAYCNLHTAVAHDARAGARHVTGARLRDVRCAHFARGRFEFARTTVYRAGAAWHRSLRCSSWSCGRGAA